MILLNLIKTPQGDMGVIMKNDKRGLYLAFFILVIVVFMIFYMFFNINKEVSPELITNQREHSSPYTLCESVGIKKLGMTISTKIAHIYIFTGYSTVF